MRAVPSGGQITARKGGAVTLECKASGNPVPSIYWMKKVQLTIKLSTVVVCTIELLLIIEWYRKVNCTYW